MKGSRVPRTVVDTETTEVCVGEPLQKFLLDHLADLERVQSMHDVEKIRRHLRYVLYVVTRDRDPEARATEAKIIEALQSGESVSETAEELRTRFAEDLAS